MFRLRISSSDLAIVRPVGESAWLRVQVKGHEPRLDLTPIARDVQRDPSDVVGPSFRRARFDLPFLWIGRPVGDGRSKTCPPWCLPGIPIHLRHDRVEDAAEFRVGAGPGLAKCRDSPCRPTDRTASVYAGSLHLPFLAERRKASRRGATSDWASFESGSISISASTAVSHAPSSRPPGDLGEHREGVLRARAAPARSWG